MNKSLQWKLVAIFILIAIFLLLPITVFLSRQVEEQYYQEFKEGIEKGFNNWSVTRASKVQDIIADLRDKRSAITEFNIVGEYKSYSIIDINDINNILYSSDSLFYNDRELFINELLNSKNMLAVLAAAGEGTRKSTLAESAALTDKGTETGTGTTTIDKEINVSTESAVISKEPAYTALSKTTIQSKGNNSTLVKTSNRMFFDYARVVEVSDGSYILYFKYDSKAWSNLVTEFNMIIIRSLLMSVVISLFLGFLLSKTITGPLTKISKRASEIATGNFDKSLPVLSGDEIGQLTGAFNNMAQNLKDTMTEISSEKNKIETILNYMTDGVVAFNIKGEVIHANPAAHSILGKGKINTGGGQPDRPDGTKEKEEIDETDEMAETDEMVEIDKAEAVPDGAIEAAVFRGGPSGGLSRGSGVGSGGVIGIEPFGESGEEIGPNSVGRSGGAISSDSAGGSDRAISIDSLDESDELKDMAETNKTKGLAGTSKSGEPGGFNFNIFAKWFGLDISIEQMMYLDSFHSREANVKYNDKFLRIYFAVFSGESKKPEGIITVIQDITEQHKLEEMRKEFVANVSHELRTPLTSIKSYTETLLNGELNDTDTAMRFLNVINSEADRMTRLVRDLLQLSRFDNSQMQWNMQEGVSLPAIVNSSIEKLRLEAKTKKLSIVSHTIGDMLPVKADADRLEQVVLNILSNAIKYTPGGGQIFVYLGRLYNEVYFKVVDTGIGIPAKDLPRIFERFYRVDKARSREMGGTGLGLSIAKEIVIAHKGNIYINSEVGKGTEVTVRLPIAGIKAGEVQAPATAEVIMDRTAAASSVKIAAASGIDTGNITQM